MLAPLHDVHDAAAVQRYESMIRDGHRPVVLTLCAGLPYNADLWSGMDIGGLTGYGWHDREIGNLRAVLARRGEREESADAIAHRLFSVFDVDGSGTVDHTELAAGLTTLCRNASRGGAGGVSEAFALYDIDGDGVVSREEMASFLRSVFTTAFRSDPNKHAAMGLISARDLAAITTASAFRLAKIDSASSMDLSAFARWWTHQNGVEGDRGHLVRPAAEHFQSKLRAPIATAQVARSPACAPSKPRPKPPQGRPRSRRPVNTPLAQRQPKGVRSGRGRARQRARGRGARTPRGRGRTIG